MQEKAPKILIVDDEPNIVMAIEYLMQQQGYLTETAKDGEEALEKFQAFSPDLIILDVMMPKMHGYDVARRIRSDAANAATQIVFLTAKSADADRMVGYDSGGEVYLTKPFQNQELIERVREQLEYRV